MFTIAVAGPPLPEPPCEALVSDALADTLSPEKGPLRILVPAVPDSLTEGVRAVVEWAWNRPHQASRTVAIYDGHLCYDDDEKTFLESGADEVLGAADVAGMIVDELAGAMPDAAMLVVLHEAEPDALTLAIVNGCLDADVPVFDVSHGAIPLCRQDVQGWEKPAAAEGEKKEVANDTPAEVPAVEEQPASNTPKMAVAPVTVDPPTEHEVLKGLRRQFVQIEKVAAEAINDLDDVIAGKPRSRAVRDYPILISTDGGVTKHPRGRGKAPKGSIEYNGKTGEVLRVH